MPQLPEEDLARKAYNAYAGAQNWRDLQGPMMRWEAIRDEVRQGWSAAVQCIKLELEKDAAVRGVQEKAQQEQRQQAERAAHGQTQADAPRTSTGRP